MEYYFPGKEELQTVFDSLKGNNEKSLIENLRNNFARSKFLSKQHESLGI